MEKDICDNKVFGIMKYDYEWEKVDEIKLFEKEYNITIIAEAFPDEDISKEQEESYLKFKENEKSYIETVENKLKEYINENL